MQQEVLFELDGRPVHRGDRLCVAPSYQNLGGSVVEAYRAAIDGHAIFRAVPTGAVPTLPVSAVSWAPHPDTVDLEVMRRQGIRRPSVASLNVWRLGRAAASQPDSQTVA